MGANEELLEAIKMHDDLVRIGIEQGALERALAEQRVRHFIHLVELYLIGSVSQLRALTAITSYKPTPAETSIVDQIFDMADTRRTGSISSYAAVKIFGGSKLSPSTLAGVWRIANVEESEMLSKQVIGVAVRLIGHAQRHGGKVVEDWVALRASFYFDLFWENVPMLMIFLAGPVAEIEGFNSSNDGHRFATGPSGSTSDISFNLPVLTTEDRAKFIKIFISTKPDNGVLTGMYSSNAFSFIPSINLRSEGTRAREVLMKSRLPEKTLAEIW